MIRWYSLYSSTETPAFVPGEGDSSVRGIAFRASASKKGHHGFEESDQPINLQQQQQQQQQQHNNNNNNNNNNNKVAIIRMFFGVRIYLCCLMSHPWPSIAAGSRGYHLGSVAFGWGPVKGWYLVHLGDWTSSIITTHGIYPIHHHKHHHCITIIVVAVIILLLTLMILMITTILTVYAGILWNWKDSYRIVFG